MVPAAGASFLRIVSPPPGFFLGDTRVELAVNGGVVLAASFLQGFDWWAPMPPGVHVVETRLVSPIGLDRKKSYRLEVRPALVTLAVLDYSRMWGNMTDSPKSVTFVPC